MRLDGAWPQTTLGLSIRPWELARIYSVSSTLWRGLLPVSKETARSGRSCAAVWGG